MAIEKLIEDHIISQMTPVIELDLIETVSAGRYKLHSCNTEWATIGDTITIDGVNYLVVDFSINEYLIVTGPSLPVQLYFQLEAPTFEHGNHRKVAVERDKQKDKRAITPMVYMMLTRNTRVKDYDSPYSFDGEARFFFLGTYNEKKDDIDTHQQEVIEPMRAMAKYFREKWNEREDLFEQITECAEQDWMNFGSPQVWGNNPRIFDENLSGVENAFRILSVADEDCCENIPAQSCLPSTLKFDGVLAEAINSGSTLDITVEDQDGNTPDYSYNATNDKLTVQTGGGETPVNITVNGTPFYEEITTDRDLPVKNSDASNDVGSKVGTEWRIGDSTIVIKNTIGSIIQTETVNAEGNKDATISNVSWTDSDGSMQSTPYGEIISCTIPPSYDPSAQALFDRVLELEPIYGFSEDAKQIFSDFISAWKESGIWYQPEFWCIACVPTLNVFATLIEIKSLAIQSVFADTTAMNPPYNIALRVGTTYAGYTCRDTGYINLNFIPSIKMVLNDSCAGIMTYSNETGTATFNFGALTSSTSSTAFSKKLNTGAMVGDAYGSTVGTGRVSVASSSGSKGYAYLNRVSTAFAEIVENGSTVGSITGSQGTLPTITEYAWTFNNNGTPSTRRLQSPIVMLWKSRAWTSPQKTIMHTALDAFQNNSKRKAGLETKQIIIASNSHGVYWHGAFQRAIDYFTFAQGVKVVNVSISGRQTLNTIGIATGLIPTYASVVAPLYDPSLDENWVYLNEATNDLWFNGNLAQAKQNYIDYVNLCHATGFLVKTSPIMCRKFTSNPGGRTETQFNNDINDFNVWLLAGGSGADVVTEINPNTFVLKGGMSDAAYNTACAAICGNSTYFYDASTIGTHLVESEYFIWGKQFLDAN